ncbi:hypothetical protein AE09_00623 [Klebsiella pneumoniae BWH 46]|nr:hypothetical protein AE09_00623 [Klebsiella pneumoniae BWH 46]
MSRIDTLVCTDARKTKYRFVVLTMIFLVYAINYADRTNEYWRGTAFHH